MGKDLPYTHTGNPVLLVLFPTSMPRRSVQWTSILTRKVKVFDYQTERGERGHGLPGSWHKQMIRSLSVTFMQISYDNFQQFVKYTVEIQPYFKRMGDCDY